MVNSAMDVEDQNEQSLDVLKEQFIPGDDYALKVRKPYTITKQRERWTEEEHTKFIEALKLYGRAWRRIEEHVGTKTTVQIRSHAQKFFSKVVRESNGGDATSIKPIEIPPPRPKRKPMRPYPRKMTSPVKSRDLSGGERETSSPTSVLSPVGSDTLAAPGSNTPHVGSPSPVSEENRSSSNQANASSNIEEEDEEGEGEEAAVKLELFPQEAGSPKEGSGSADASSAQYLKLFGQTVLVTDYHKPSSTLTPATTKGSPVPWWTSCGGGGAPSYASVRVYSPVPTKACSDTQKEVSATGSNTDSVGGLDGDVEAQSLGSTKIGLIEHRDKGFIPYKRCLAERDSHSHSHHSHSGSSTLASEERSEQRVRLCL